RHPALTRRADPWSAAWEGRSRPWVGSTGSALQIQLLALFAEERAAARAAEFLAVAQPGAVARAMRLGVHLVVLLQHEGLLPLQEIEAVLARLLDQFAELFRRERADLAFRVHADPPQHFVLDDVADAGEPLLVEQGVGGEHVRAVAQALARPGRVPGVGHDVYAPVVELVDLAFEELHRARVEVEPAVVELQRETGRAAFLRVVDPGAAEQHEVDAQDEAVEIQQEVLAPAADRADLAAVAATRGDRLAGELRRRRAQDEEGGAFGHGPQARWGAVNLLWEVEECGGHVGGTEVATLLSRLPPLPQVA